MWCTPMCIYIYRDPQGQASVSNSPNPALGGFQISCLLTTIATKPGQSLQTDITAVIRRTSWIKYAGRTGSNIQYFYIYHI